MSLMIGSIYFYPKLGQDRDMRLICVLFVLFEYIDCRESKEFCSHWGTGYCERGCTQLVCDFLIFASRLPPSQNYVKIQQYFSSQKTSLQYIIFQCFMAIKTYTSDFIRISKFCCLSDCALTTFTANLIFGCF